MKTAISYRLALVVGFTAGVMAFPYVSTSSAEEKLTGQQARGELECRLRQQEDRMGCDTQFMQRRTELYDLMNRAIVRCNANYEDYSNEERDCTNYIILSVGREVSRAGLAHGICLEEASGKYQRCLEKSKEGKQKKK